MRMTGPVMQSAGLAMALASETSKYRSRGAYGRTIKRVYFFNVSSTSDDRLNCQLTLIGSKLIDWYVPPYPSDL